MALTPIEEQQLLEHLTNWGNPHKTTMTKSGLQTTDDLPEGLVNLYAQVGGLIYIEGAAPYQDIINLPSPQDGELWVSTTDDTSHDISIGDGILYDEDTDVWTDIGPLQGPQGIPGKGIKGDPGTPIHHTRFLREDTEYDYYGLWLDASENEFIGEYAVKQSEGADVPPGSEAEITIATFRNLVGGGTFQLNQVNNENLVIRHALMNQEVNIPFGLGIGIKTLHLDNGHITSIEKQSCDSRYYLKGGDRLTGPMDAGTHYITNLYTNTNDPLGAVNFDTLLQYVDNHTHEIADITNLADSLSSKMPKAGGAFQGLVDHSNNILTNFLIPTDFSLPEVQRWPIAIGSIYGLLDEFLPRNGSLGMAGHLSMSSEDEHGTTHSYHIHQMEQPSDIFDPLAVDWAASIGLVAVEFDKYLKHDGSIPLSGTLNADSNKIENLSAEFTDPLTNAASIGLITNHTHPMSAITDLDDEFLKHYQKVEYLTAHVDPGDPTQSADHPIKLNTEGKISPEFITISVFNNRGNWTPTAGTEYPDITGAAKGDFWMIDGVDDTLGYTFTTGDLNGETTYNGDLIILREDSGTLVWLLRSSQIDPNIYLPLAGGTMLGNISMGDSFTITNILEDGHPNSAVTRASVVLLDGTQIMTGNLSIQKDTPSIYFDDTGSVNPNTWGYGILDGKCTIHIKLTDTTTEAKFTIDDDSKLLNLRLDGLYYDSSKLLDENSTIDADTLQTHPASDFAPVNHDHTTFVKKVGDRMTGNLLFSKFNVLINTSKGDTTESDSWIKGFGFLDNTDTLYGGLGSYGSLDAHLYQFWGVGESPQNKGVRLYDDGRFYLNQYELYHEGNLDLSGYSPIDHNHDTEYLAIDGKAADSELLDGLDSSAFAPISHEHIEADITDLDKYSRGEVNTLLNGKEDYLDVPLTDNQVLSSKADGTREWVDLPDDVQPAIWGNITGTLSDQDDLQLELDGKSNTGHNHDTSYYKKDEFINISTGSSDADKPILLNSQGQIDPSMIDVSTFYYVGPFTPATGAEYPDTTGETFGAFWVVQGLSTDYTFTGGDLVGESVSNGDFMVWANAGWSIMAGEMNPTLYYKLDGTQALTADFQAGDFKLTNIKDGENTKDAITKGQLDSQTHIEADITDLDKYTQAEVDSALNHKLDKTSQAADSNLLDGLDSSQFIRSDIAGTIQVSLDIERIDSYNTSLFFTPYNIRRFQIGSNDDGFQISRFDNIGAYVDTPFKIDYAEDTSQIPLLKGSANMWSIDGSKIFTSTDHAHTHQLASSTVDGFMSNEHWTRLDGLDDPALFLPFRQFSDGIAHAYHPIKLDADGVLDASFFSIKVFNLVGNHNPSLGQEYPTRTDPVEAAEPGDYWVIEGVGDQLTGGYTFSEPGGALEGKTIYDNELMVKGREAKWGIIHMKIDPNLYYKLDGTNHLTADFRAGGFKLIDIADGTADTDAVSKSQLDTKLNLTGGMMSGYLYFDNLMRIVFNSDDGKTTNFSYTGIDFGRSGTYLRPDVNGSYILYLGGSAIGDKDWASIVVRSVGGMTINDHEIWHAGNFDPDTKLNLTGGTLSGNLYLDDSKRVVFNSNEGKTTVLSYLGITCGRQTSYLRPDDNGLSTLYLGEATIGDKDWASIIVRSVGGMTINDHAVWHAGNFNPDTKLDLSGGTLTGSLTVNNNTPGSKIISQDIIVSSDAQIFLKALTAQSYSANIASGVTDSGYRIGLDASCYFNNPEFQGTLKTQYAIWCRHGHYGGAAGHIENSCGLFIDSLEGGTTVVDNLYSIYQANSSALNLFNGPIEANGGVKISGDDVWHAGNFTPASKENALGNPSTNGYILSSTTAGVRSWIAPPSGGGDVNWGQIGGTLSNQTDLQAHLDGKLFIDGTAYDSDRLGGNYSTDYAQYEVDNHFKERCTRDTTDSTYGWCMWETKYNNKSVYMGQAYGGSPGWANYISSFSGSPSSASSEPLYFVSHLNPDWDTAYGLGESNYKWGELHVVSVFNEGEETKIRNITTIKTIEANFLMELIPKTFEITPTGLTNSPFLADIPPAATALTHFGFVAQDIDQALITAGYDPDDFALTSGSTGNRCVNQTELIPLLVKKIQDLESRLLTIENNT